MSSFFLSIVARRCIFVVWTPACNHKFYFQATVALPPIFYGEFRSELPDEVRFVDFSGRRFTMLLHKTPSLCLIVGGFPQLINAFTIKGRCWFFMVYVGNAKFVIFHVLDANARFPDGGVSWDHPLAVGL
ncbi:hypothetical protein HN51_034624 [Arachis hypogaea]